MLYFQSILSPPATNIQPLPEYKTEAAKKPRCVIAHYGTFKTSWDVLVLLATIYVAIVVPYNACFPEEAWPPECYDLEFGLNETKMTTNSSNTASFLTNDLYQMKRSIVVDVIVEAIFILGKTSNFTSIWARCIQR